MENGITEETLRKIICNSVGEGTRFKTAAELARFAECSPSYIGNLLKYGTISNRIARIFGYAKPEKLYYPIEKGEQDE